MGRPRGERFKRFGTLPHEPCVYVAELSTGVVKVGCSTSARGRLMSLASDLNREHDGAQIGRFEVFTRLTYKAAFEAETRAVHMLAGVSESLVGRREFFTGISYDAALEVVRSAIPA